VASGKMRLDDSGVEVLRMLIWKTLFRFLREFNLSDKNSLVVNVKWKRDFYVDSNECESTEEIAR
jgi:hypothetical protein